jgi:hypothetical protein
VPNRKRDGGAGRDRTDDLKLAKLPLSQLSYGPVTLFCTKDMVGLGRLELPTSRLSGVRSNQAELQARDALCAQIE